MPIRGFLCEITSEPVACDDCVACAAAAVPPRGRRCQFTPAILRGIAYHNVSDKRVNAGISVTGLTGCLRKAFLTATVDFYDWPHRLWPATRGSMMHSAFSSVQDGGVVAEHRFALETCGVRWTGQPDEIVPERKLIVDYKTKHEAPTEPDPTHVAQLNLYRYLVTHGGIDLETGQPSYLEIDTLGIVYVTMSALRKVKVPVWSDEQTEAYLNPRLSALAEALAGGQWPLRGFTPEVDRLCIDWCPVRSHCLTQA